MGAWWKFWEAQSWRDWRAARKAWAPYRNRSLQLAVHRHRAKRRLAGHQRELARTEQHVAWARMVAPRTVPVKTAKGETGLAVVPGVRLLERRKKDGRDVWTEVDAGSVCFTDRKMVFAGRKNVEFRYAQLTAEDATPQGMLVAVSSRKRAHLLGGPVDQLAVLLGVARSWRPGTDPAGDYLRQREAEAEAVAAARRDIEAIEADKGTLDRPRRPVSPAWIPGLLLFLAIGGIGNVTASDADTRPQGLTASADSTTPATAPPPTTVTEERPAGATDPAAGAAASTSTTTTSTSTTTPSTTSTTTSSTTTSTSTTTTTTTSTTRTTTTTTTTTTTVPPTTLPANCHPSYVPCVPFASDVDCLGGSGDGPEYTGRVRVVGPDDYGLDRDGDGIGCERS